MIWVEYRPIPHSKDVDISFENDVLVLFLQAALVIRGFVINMKNTELEP